ncbi:hypothetical protein QBC35DRAFT_502647 [Podospora australis]|uniref:Heterokaryon incompatibility domain-containing protein n=1 Tax=Podospora australis TaxID=1536484 RepID=A0AAN6WQL5_9PEZI|nr:hypothetical protein QBC35DRAFT_502647 [Podospora australis]
MMGRIYSQSQKVTVWLGPEDEFSRPAITILQRLSRIPQLKARQIAKMKDDEACELLGLPSITSSSAWWAVFALLQRSWFRRVWIVQEVALAPEVQVQVGLVSLSWEMLTAACMNLMETGLGRTMDSMAWFEITGPRFEEPLFYDDIDDISIPTSDRPMEDRNLFTVLNQKKSSSSFQSPWMLEQVRTGGAEGVSLEQLALRPGQKTKSRVEKIPLLHLFENFRDFEATDARDKVYAFLEIAQRPVYRSGFEHEGLKEIKANYRLSVGEVNTEAAWYMLLSSGSLEMLCRQHMWKPLKDKAQEDGEGVLEIENSEEEDEGAEEGDKGDAVGGDKKEATEDEADPPKGQEEEMPTWVPNWSREVTSTRISSERNPPWTASLSMTWRIPSSPSSLYTKHLTVQGRYIDTIVAVADSDSSDIEMVLLSKSATIASALPETYPWILESDQTPGEVLWRTMAADSFDADTYPIPKKGYHEAFFAEWMKQMKIACRSQFTEDAGHKRTWDERQEDWRGYFMSSQELFPDLYPQYDPDAVSEPEELDGWSDLEGGDEELLKEDDSWRVALDAAEQVVVDEEKETTQIAALWKGVKETMLGDSKEDESKDDSEEVIAKKGEKDAADKDFSEEAKSQDGDADLEVEEKEQEEGTEKDIDESDTGADKWLANIQKKPSAKSQRQERLRVRHGQISTGRAIFRTEMNYLGNGQNATLPGDQVWILAGVATPLVLRPDGERFKVVGDAYVHGLMFGEGLEGGEEMMKDIELI